MKKRLSENNGFEDMILLKNLFERTISNADRIKTINPIGNFEFKMFSDNIIITQKIDKEKVDAQFFSMVNLVALMQYEALFQHHITLRGGITIGELYIDDSIVWGKGLVRAYQIENTLAMYPRVVIDSLIIDSFKRFQQNRFLKLDNDGLWFVNYFIAEPFLYTIPNLSASLHQYIVFTRYNDDDRIKQKMNWIINNFNAYCHEFDDADYGKYAIPLLP